MAMNAWNAPDDKRLIRRAGKTGEEASELAGVCSRITIQGIDEIDPSSGKTNRQRLTEEMADVLAQIACTITFLGLDSDAGIAATQARVETKIAQMNEWEELVS